LVDAQPDCLKDPVAVAVDRLGRADERSEAAAERLADEPVDQDRDVLERETGFEDRLERLLERVGAPYLAAGSAELAKRAVLLVVEMIGLLQQRPAGVFEAPRGVGIVELAQLVSVRAADVIERPVRQGDDVERIDRDDRLRRVLAGALGVAGAHVERDHFDRVRAALAELAEEPVRGLAVVALGAPHDLAAEVVGEQGEVVVLALPADLVDGMRILRMAPTRAATRWS
jgi:hypothetical protein